MEKDLPLQLDNAKNKSSVNLTETDVKIDETHTDNFKPSIMREHNIMSQTMSISSSTTAIINPLKNSSSCNTTMSIVNIPSHSNEQSKPFSRRNPVQPLLKKPISNAPTTSIKPLILPAPTSDSFSQHPKSTIVNMHSTHQSSSISTPFNCQQPMTMGIATIQPQHFGYQNLSNNRYPMIPMSIQNNYPTQQLTLTNGGLGATVQLMPVMNQNNNQMNNSRMQPMPLFMAPILGSHGGMLFQPNMTIMPQNNNSMQTFNIANTSYSHDFNPCQSILSQTIHPTTLRHSIVLPTEIESYPKPESDQLSASVNSVVNIVTVKEDTLLNSKISAATEVVNDVALLVRPSVKQRGLIRTQIYRMKPLADEEVSSKEPCNDSPSPMDSSSVQKYPGEHEESPLVNVEDEKTHNDEATDNDRTNTDFLKPPSEPEIVSVCVSSATIVPSPVICPIVSQCSQNEKHTDSKLSQIPLATSHKRKLPSPEILDGPQPTKIARLYHEPEQPLSGRKSPGSLFEKIAQVIPERKNEILQTNWANKLTAVVRPEQRKMLVHYLDDLIIFESDEPFPTTNKMQVVKSALRAGNIKLNPQKSKQLNDQYLFLSADEEMSPSKHRANLNNKLSPTLKSTSFLEPLTIDIPTTTSSSCDSLDSSQVRPLSVCSYQSTLLSKMLCAEHNYSDKEMPKIEKQKSTSSIQSESFKEKVISKPMNIENNNHNNNKKADIITTIIKEPAPVKKISPIKVDKPEKCGLDRPICDWSVADVVDFVKQTPGCENYASLFQNHEIDGEALLLLSKDNLIQGALNMKIGPALKLCAKIEKRKALDPH